MHAIEICTSNQIGGLLTTWLTRQPKNARDYERCIQSLVV